MPGGPSRPAYHTPPALLLPPPGDGRPQSIWTQQPDTPTMAPPGGPCAGYTILVSSAAATRCFSFRRTVVASLALPHPPTGGMALTRQVFLHDTCGRRHRCFASPGRSRPTPVGGARMHENTIGGTSHTLKFPPHAPAVLRSAAAHPPSCGMRVAEQARVWSRRLSPACRPGSLFTPQPPSLHCHPAWEFSSRACPGAYVV